MTEVEEPDACAVAHGTAPDGSHQHTGNGHADHEHSSAPDVGSATDISGTSARTGTRTLLTVFDSPVSRLLLRYGADLGYRTVLWDPGSADPATATLPESSAVTDPDTDVVVTDHHRTELAAVLRDLLGRQLRWIGVMGNPRHRAPYLDELEEWGTPSAQLERIHRPIGLNIGSRTPAEIAVATLAGLIADRNGRPGGQHF